MFHRAQCWDLCSLFCTLFHCEISYPAITQSTISFLQTTPNSKINSTTWRAKPYTHDLQPCTDDIKAWMCNNQLKLYEDKIEAFLFSTPSLSSCHYLLSSVMVGTHEMVFSDKVRKVGFILDSNLTMKQHAIKICQTAYYELKRISSIRRYLTEGRCRPTWELLLPSQLSKLT